MEKTTIRLLWKGTSIDGRINIAELENDRGKRFRWSRSLPLQQWIDYPVSGDHGYGDGYYRTASKKTRDEVDKLLIALGLLETDAARHARIAKEAIG